MKSLRKVLGFLVAPLMFVAFALSSGAALADKTYTLTLSPTTGTSPIATMIATFTNTGSSSFNSFTLTLPTNYTIVGTPVLSSSKGTISYASGVITVLNIGLPVGAGATEVVTVTMANVASTGTCGTGTSGTWVAKVYSGSSLNGSVFSGNTPSTSIVPQCNTVTTAVSPAGSGTLTCTPNPVPYGGSTICTATPAAGWGFLNFSGDCTGTSCTVSGVTTSKSVTANFGQSTITATASPTVGGSVTCTPNPVPYGSSSTCTATPAAGWGFVNFTGACTGTSTTCTITGGTTAKSVTANFAQNAISSNVSPAAGSGTLTCTPNPVPYGGSSICTAAPAAGWGFVNFTGDCTGTSPLCTLSGVTAAKSVTANFGQSTITATASPAAGGSVNCTPNPVPYGSSSTCTASANALYTFTGFSGDCTGTSTSCTLTGGTTSKSVTASFVSNSLSIVSKPSSAVIGTAFQVSVGISPAGGSVSADTSACGGANATLDVSSTSSLAVFNITIPSTYNGTTCTINFDATNYVSIPLSSLPVYKGVLGCGDYDSINGPTDTLYDPDGFLVPPSPLTTVVEAGYVGPAGWGLRRGPNKDGAACVKVNYTCDMTANATTNVVTCTWDKNVVPTQLATFKYLFLWAPRAPDASGWTSYRPWVSWPPADPDNSGTWPNYAPIVYCVSDLFSTPPTLILPTIPNAAPFNNSSLNTLAQYQPGALAYVCGAQQGSTAVGAPGTLPGNGVQSIQTWNIIIDEADLRVIGP